MSADELIYLTDRIATFSPLPVLVDCDEGYGDSPINTYRNIMRLVKAGAQGFTLDDGMGVRGWIWSRNFTMAQRSKARIIELNNLK